MLSNSNITALKESIKNGSYEWNHIPAIIKATNSVVYVNRSAPYRMLPVDVAMQSVYDRRDQDMIKTEKLKIDSSGDWELNVFMINTAYFDSRDQLDEFFCESNERTVNRHVNKYAHIDEISIDEVLDGFSATISANIEYYLRSDQNLSELENDLGRKIDKHVVKNSTESELKSLSDEVFYKLMCGLFGEVESEREFKVRDYRMLSHDGNSCQATGVRGEFYLLFFYNTS